MSGVGRQGGTAAVPAPVPPDDADAWYAPGVREQDEIYPGVVVTVRRDDRFQYEVREPVLGPDATEMLTTVKSYFDGANIERPRTREGAVERMDSGFDPKHRRVIDRLVDCSPATRRRIAYHALCSLACLGELTPYALDDRIDVADVTDDGVVVHTEDYAPVETGLGADPDYIDRFASERVGRHTVRFHEFEVPVVVYREHLLGSDPFTTKYAVREPDLLPGDEELIEACKERVWETSVDGLVEDSVAFVRDRASSLLARQLTVRNTTEWLDAARYRVRAALSELDLAVPPVDRRFADDRLDDLLYYVLRDLVGHGKLTIPIRDHTLEDIEANRVGERVKVLPRTDLGHDGRVPTNLSFDSESAFVNVVTQLAADDGTELNASNPSAKVNIDPEGGVHDSEETIRCAVALPTISEDGPHISIRKQSADAMTPVDLVERDSLPTELVALLWLLYESHGVVLFSGPTGAGKTTLLNAHMPFIPYRDRPISIDEGSREVRIPHETGVSLTTRDHERDHRRVTMADLMTQCNYLNPDVEVIAEINTPASFETFAETLNTGHGVLGTTHAADIETLVNRVIEKGVPTYLLEEIDLVVFPRHVGGDRYVGEVVEFVDDPIHDRCETIEKDGETIHYNTLCRRGRDGTFELAYDHPQLGDDHRRVGTDVFDRLATLRDEPVEAVEETFHRRHRYVQYLVREGVTDFTELFGVLADLETNEAATVERLRRTEATADPLHIEVGEDGD
ncbi:type II/IV secretion system ATPase subunit [Halomicroarcula sp. S1AR25-4]|uniref:type II/IV secretion system ATPase subunit n=1 Tax=Haloarcula sp. S1AR25-4 TaxID=2950538 RepID=UPI0028750F44|nr:type II/IV secretion system ATPase subunit [Halomicroarcula sp. S1AR25-4]MDS0277579.1 type II/IV secretion system ATPase subunit [Halomicroarcula sp. S1AR25-4]